MKSILENVSILTCNGAKYLRYDIREIVSIACQLELAGKSITWENIGDPIAKGHKPPLWLVQELTNLISNPKCFAYGPSEGLLESRRFLCNQTNTLFQTALKPEHIVFFNGFLAENRPSYSPAYKEIEETLYANYLTPLHLFDQMRKNRDIKKLYNF